MRRTRLQKGSDGRDSRKLYRYDEQFADWRWKVFGDFYPEQSGSEVPADPMQANL